MIFRPVEEALQEAIVKGVFPGAVVLVGRGEEILFERAVGFRSQVPDKTPMQLETVFDLASLTKPLATSTAMMFMVREKKVCLEDRVTRFFADFGVFGKTQVTLRHLLAHCSGLPAWKPYYQEVIQIERKGRVHFVASRAAKSYIFEKIHREKPVAPAATQSLYSDLGFMLLGELVEEITGWTLDRYCQERVFKPLGLHSTFFVDLTLLPPRRIKPVRESVAPTENCPWRKRLLSGEVHDDNAYVMGGVAGHAGLFSSAGDVHLFLTRLRRCFLGDDSFLPASLVREFLARDRTVQQSNFALGWDTPSPNGSSSGGGFSPHSVGHLGFTGTSVWWDLEKDCHVILLTNRVHPSRDNDKIKEFRPYIHDLIIKAISQ